MPSDQHLHNRSATPTPDSMHSCFNSLGEEEKMSEDRQLEVAERVVRSTEISESVPDTTSDEELAKVLQQSEYQQQPSVSANFPSAPPVDLLPETRNNQPPPNIFCHSGSIRCMVDGINYSGCYHQGIWVSDPSENDNPFSNLESLNLLPSGLAALCDADLNTPTSPDDLTFFTDLLTQVPDNHKAIIIQKYSDTHSFTINFEQLQSFIRESNGSDIVKILQTLKPRFTGEELTGSSKDRLIMAIMPMVSNSDKATIIQSLLDPKTDKLGIETFSSIINNISNRYKEELITALKTYLVETPSNLMAVQIVNSCSNSCKVAVISSLLKNSMQLVTPDALYAIVSGASNRFKADIIKAIKPYLSAEPSPQLINNIVQDCSRSYRSAILNSLPIRQTHAISSFQQVPTDLPPSYAESISSSEGGQQVPTNLLPSYAESISSSEGGQQVPTNLLPSYAESIP
ncbi:hypothetical protein [Endozoicomonas ascidiicola]|uniref:hypothetical protein n=1 Tax=Endozoicomonas ascidiicola TaxID=1698521 RepID=UPI00082F3E09|nr:hypothetical protein [Endozoicomonas ascidiicola]